jgi:hypothetical protein
MQNQDDDAKSQSDHNAINDENDRQMEDEAQAGSNIGMQSNDDRVDTNARAEEPESLSNSQAQASSNIDVQSNDNDGGIDTNTRAEETDLSNSHDGVDTNARAEKPENLSNCDHLHQYIISSMNQVPKFSDEWFMLIEKEISLLNHNGLLAADEEETADQIIEGTFNRTVEPIADGVVAPAPNAQVGTSEFLARPEQMSSTNDAPKPFMTDLDVNDEDSTNKKIMTGATLEQVSDDSAPTPIGHIEQNKDDIDMKMSAAIPTESSDVDIENNSHGVEEDEVPSSGNSTQLNHLHSRVVSFLDTVPYTSRVNTNGDVSGEPHLLEEIANSLTAGIQQDINSGLQVDHADVDKLPEIPEAYRVDDGTVIIATNSIPWWKQRRTKILFCFVLLLVVAVLAVTLKITLTPERTVTKLVAVTASPTISAIPSLQPSLVPSSSQMPSSSPSACSYRVSNSTRKVELDLISTSQTGLKTAIDGLNLVVAWKQFYGEWFEEGSFYIAFYSLTGDNQWILSGYHIEENVNFELFGSMDNDFDLDISGPTAVIGLPAIGMVYVFRQDNAGLWVQISSPPVKYDTLGVFVYICNDLLAVADSSKTTYELMQSVTYFFERQGGEWKQIGVEQNDADLDCGYDYNCSSPIPAILARNITKYPCRKSYSYASIEEDGFNIYQWDESKNTSTVTQLNSSDYDADGFGPAFALVDGLLVVSSSNYTHIFARENKGQWEEVLTLDKSYDSYALSGRTLVVVKGDEVYSMNVADCTPEPIIPKSSMDTKCYEVDVFTQFSYKTATSFWTSIWPSDDVWSELPYSQDAETTIECNETTVGFMMPWSLTILQSDFLMSDSKIASSTYGDGCDCGVTSSAICLDPGWYKGIFQRSGDTANNKYPWQNICHNITFDFNESSESGFNLTRCSSVYDLVREEIEFDIPLTTMRWLSPTSSPTATLSPT